MKVLVSYIGLALFGLGRIYNSPTGGERRSEQYEPMLPNKIKTGDLGTNRLELILPYVVIRDEKPEDRIY